MTDKINGRVRRTGLDVYYNFMYRWNPDNSNLQIPGKNF